MAIAASSLTSGSDGTDGTVYTTASVTPTANRLVLLAVSSRHDGVDSTPTASGNGLTWVQVATIADASFGTIRTTLFRAMGASPSAGAITITFGTTQRRCGWSVVEFSGVTTEGTNGSAAIVQAVTDGTASDGGGVVDVTLAAFGSAAHGTYGAVTAGTAGPAFTPGSGFTEIHDQDIEAAIAQQTQWRATTDTTVDWSTGSSIVAAAIAVELKSKIAVIQRANDPGGGNVSLTSVVAGAFLVLIIEAVRFSATPLISSVSGGSATWTLRHTSATTERGIWIYTGAGTAGGTVTMTTSGTYDEVTTVLYELSRTDCVYDTGNAATGNSTALSSGASAALSSLDDLAIAGGIVASKFNDFTPGGGFTEDFEAELTGIDYLCTSSQLQVTALTAVTGLYTAGLSGLWACAVVAIKPAPAAPSLTWVAEQAYAQMPVGHGRHRQVVAY